MGQEKIASRLILADGTTFNIGTVGVVENVAVKLSAPTSEDWASYKVIVQDITDGANNGEYQLNTLGEAKFFIPMGHTYSVMLPIVEGYTQPLIITLTAQLASRVITHEYSMGEVQYEQINISAFVVNGDVAMLNGKLVVAKAESGNVYAEEFANGKITMRIPYGEKCKLTLPDIEGWWRDGLNIQLTTGLPSRDILVHYSETILGTFGIDDDGNTYTLEQLEEMKENSQDLSFIKYIGFNNAALAQSDRGDGTFGCGFLIDIENYLITGNILDRRINISTLPIIGKQEAKQDYKSAYNTTAFLLAEGIDSVTAELANKARNSKVVIGGIERHGNWAAGGIILTIFLNKDSFNRIMEITHNTTMAKFPTNTFPASGQSNFNGATMLNFNGVATDYFYISGTIQSSGTSFLVYDL